MKSFKQLLSLTALILITTYVINAQFVGPAPLVVPGDNYAFAYSSNGAVSGLTSFGLYFDETGGTPGYRFTNGSGAKLVNIQSITAGNREPGDITFGSTGSLIINPNRYAFRFSLTNSYGLFFNAAGFAYEFRTADASSVLSIGANSGDIAFEGTATIGSVPQDNALTEVLVKDANGLVHYRDVSTLGGGGGLWTASGSNVYHTGGNVGIGTSSPGFELDVRGNMRLGDTTNSEQDIWFLSGSGGWQVGTNNDGNGTNDNHFYIFDGSYRFTAQAGTGNIGIGTSSPEYKLDVRGDMRLGDGIDPEQDIFFSCGSGNWQVGTNNAGNGTNDNHFYIHDASSYRLTVQAGTGNVGIGGIPSSVAATEIGLEIEGKFPQLILNDNDGGAVDNFSIVSSGGSGWFENSTSGSRIMTLDLANGNVGIGTNTPQSKLAVNGTIICKEVEVTLSGFPDYVFDEDYNLLSLDEVAQYIDANGHLPNMPTEAEVIANGVGLGELNVKLVEKIEELTLHLIEKDEELRYQRAIIEEQSGILKIVQKQLSELREMSY